MAEVIARSMGFEERMLTDANGVYAFRGLRQGRYTITCEKPPFVRAHFGSTHAFAAEREIALAPGQAIDGIDCRLRRGGVITGRVVGADGEPIPRASVDALRLAGGRLDFASTHASYGVTDDRGEYRIYGLAPGRYVVRARSMQPMALNDETGRRLFFAPGYYPAVADANKAEHVSVTRAAETRLAPLTLHDVPVVSVSGVVFRSDGKRASRGSIGAVQILRGTAQARAWGSASAMVEPDGFFVLSDVTPGEYRLHVLTFAAVPPQPIRSVADEGQEAAVMSIRVARDPIEGLKVTTNRGTRVRGRLAFEAGVTPSFLPVGVQVWTSPVDHGSQATPLVASVRPDWSFELRALAGRRVLSVALPPGWTTTSIRHRSTELLDRAIDFGSVEAWDGVQVTVSTRIPRVSGSVTDDRGRHVSDYTVVVFTQDRDRWNDVTRVVPDGMAKVRPLLRTVRAGRPDQHGRFAIDDLPAGPYLAIATTDLEEGEWADPETLTDLARNADRFVLAPGEAKQLALRVVSGWRRNEAGSDIRATKGSETRR